MKRITYLLIALVVIASLGLTGCGEAELGTEENPIIWALVPSGETETVLTGFQGVADILYEETGLVIEPFVATEYAGVIEAMSADPPKAHMASLATFAYIVASAVLLMWPWLLNVMAALPTTARSSFAPTVVSLPWKISQARPSAALIP